MNSAQKINLYKDYLIRSGVSPATIERKLSSVRSYFAFIEHKQSLSVISKKSEKLIPVSTPIFTNENFIEKLASLGIEAEAIKVALPRQKSKFSQNLSNSYSQLITKVKKARYTIPYSLKYSQPKWLISYQKKSISRFVNYGVLLIVCVSLGIGGYEQFIKRTQKEGQVLGVVPVKPPTVLSFQGRLTDAGGTPITSTKTFTFNLYNIGTGGTALWTESKSISPDSDGIFNTYIGDSAPIDQTIFRDNTNVYLGVAISPDEEMTSRQQVATVGYAFNSQYLQGYDVGSTGAQINQIPVVNSDGNIVIAASSPAIQSSTGSFKIIGAEVYITTTGGNINFDPNALGGGGSGNINLTSSIVNGNVINATSSALRSGALIYGDIGNTASGIKLIQLQVGNTASDAFFVDVGGSGFFSGNLGIGVTRPSYKLEVNGGGKFSGGVNVGAGLSVSNGVTFSGLSTGTGTTALFTDVNGNLSTRVLGTNAFNSNTYDNYVSWSLLTNGLGTTAILSGNSVNLVNGVGISMSQNGSTITINNTGTGTTYSANNGITLSGSNFFQLGGQLSQLTKIDMNSNNLGFWGTGNVGIGTTNQTQKLDVNGSVNVGGSLRTSTMLYVGTGASVTGDVSINGGDLSSNQTTFRLLDNTVTTLYVGGAATALELGAATGITSINNGASVDLSLSVNGGNITTNDTTFNLLNGTATTINFGGAATMMELGAATGVLSINTGASVDGTLYTAANLRVGTSANITTNLNVGGTFRVNNNSFVLDNGGNVTTGTWKATAVGVSYGGTGLTTTPTSGQLLIGNNNGYTLGTISVGNSLTVTNGAGTISISHADTSSQTNSDNSNGVVIQDIGLDGLGHLTSLATVDLDSRYLQTANVNWVLKGDAGTPETVGIGNTAFIVGGSGVTSTVTATDTLTLDVGAGNGITVGADSVAVDQAYAFAWTGSQSWSQPGIFYGNLSVIGNVGIGTTATQKLDVNGSVNVGGSITTGTTITVGTNLYTVGSVNVGTSAQIGTNLLVGSSANINGALTTTGAITAPTSTNTINTMVIDATGNVTTGTWKATAIGVSYGGTGLTTTPTSGQLLIGNNNGYTLGTISVGNSLTVTNGAGTISISHADTSSQTNSDNSNGVVIQDIGLDGLGHLTSLATVDLDSRYLQTANVNWVLKGDAGTPETVGIGNTAFIVGGSGVTSTVTATDTLTLDVGAGNGITVGADSVAVDQAYAFAWTGSQSWSQPGIFYGTLSVIGNVGIGTTATQKLDVNGSVNVGGSITTGTTINVGTDLYTVGSVNVGTSAQIGTNLLVGSSANINGALTTTGAITAPTTTNTINGLVIDATGNVTTGTWKATAIGVSYGGTGLTTTPTSGQLLIGNNNGYTLGTISVGNSLTVTNGAGTISISHADTSSQTNSDNSNGVVIQDIGLDGLGHLTSLATVDLDSRYLQTANVNWVLKGDSGTPETVGIGNTAFIVGGSGMSSVVSATDTLTLNIGAGNGISVAADGVAVDQAYAFAWTGSQSWSQPGIFYGTLSVIGNVGIGTTATQKLDVNGSVNVGGSVRTGTMLYVGTGASVTGDASINGGDLTSNQTTFRLLDNTVTTLYVGGAATSIELGAATGVLSINTGASVDGTLYTAANLRVGTSANITTNLNVGGTFRVNNNSFVLDNGGNVTTGTWKATAVGVSYGGTGLTTTPTSGQLLIGNNNGYTLGTISVGNSLTVTNGAGTISISHADTSSQTNSDNSNGVVIQDIGLDGLGHLTSLATVDLDSRYLQTANVNWVLKGDAGTPETVGIGNTAFIVGGSGVTSTVTATDTLTLDVGAGNGITVGADSVAVDQAYAFAWTGSQSWSQPGIFYGNLSVIGNVGIGTTATQKLDVNGSVNVGGSITTGTTINVGTDLYTVGSVNVGTSAQIGTNLLVGSSANINGALTTTGAITAPTTTNTINGLVIDATGNVTTGTWKATAIGVSYGGTGLTTTPTSGQLLIGNNNGYTLGTISVGNSLTVTNGAGTISISHADTSSQTNSDNSNGVVIQDIGLDGLGHLTSLATVDLDSRYLQTANVNWVLKGDSGTPETVGIGNTAFIVGGSGMSSVVSATDTLTLNIGAGNGISVAADGVAVDQAYAFAWTGSQSWSQPGIFYGTLSVIGNVGIGTTATQKLDVNGSVNVGGSVRTGTMLYVGTGASVSGDVSINGGDLSSNQTTFNLLNNTVTTLNIGGAATVLELGAATGITSINNGASVDLSLSVNGGNITTNDTTFNLLNGTATTINFGGAATLMELGAATGVLSINTGASVDGTLYTAANLRVGTSANVTTNLNVGGTFRVNNSSFVLDNGGNVTTGIWKGTAVGTSYGGTGLTTTATSGQLLIGNNNGYTLATLTAGTGIGITNAAGSITINAIGNSTGTTYSANNGITLTGSNFFQWGGQLSQLTTIDMNSNNIGFWNTGNVGIGTTSPGGNLDVFGDVSVINVPDISQRWSTDNADYNLRLESIWTSFGINQNFIQRFAATDYNVLSFSAGNVGIGTTSPGYKLGVAAASGSVGVANFTTNDYISSTTGSSFLIRFGTASGNTYTNLSALSGGEQAWNNLVLQSGGGNVGIGTTSPTQVLDVNGSVNVGGSLRTGTMLYVGTGASVTGDVSVNGGDISSNQTTFRLLDNTVTTLNIGGAATVLELGAATGITSINNGASVDLSLSVNGANITTNDTTFNLLNGTATTINFGGAATLMELGAATGVLSINTGASVDGTLYTAANLRVGTSANITTNLNVGGTFRVNNSSFVLDNGGNITTGIWKGTAVGTSYGGTGLTTTATSGQLLIGNNNGYTLATLTAGTGIGITNAAGSITINVLGGTGAGTTYSANNGITKTGSNFFQWGGQLSQLTTIDMNSNNIGFWNTGNFGIGTTSPAFKLDVNGIINTNSNLEVGTVINSPYGGIGRYQNQIGQSEEFNTGWNTVGTLTVTPNSTTAPNGETTADTLAAGTAGAYIYWTTGIGVTTGGSAQTFTYSVWAKTSSGTQNFQMDIAECGYDGGGAYPTYTATTTWQRFTVTRSSWTNGAGTACPVIFPGTSGGTGTIIAWGAQNEQSVTTAGTYVKTTGTAISTASNGIVASSATGKSLLYGNVGIGYVDPGTAALAINGNVGIGTTSPLTKLSIEVPWTAGTKTPIISAQAGAFTLSSISNVNEDIVTSDTGLAFNTMLDGALTEKVRISSGGNVGIGTTSPTQVLDVNGSVNVGGSLRTGTMLYVGTGASVTGDVSVNGGDISSNQTTFRLLDNTVTTLNVGGAATALELGAATGITSINNGASVDLSLSVNGGNITTNDASFNLLNGTATTINFGGAATLMELGAATGVLSINTGASVDGTLYTAANLRVGTSANVTTNLNVGGTFRVNNSSFVLDNGGNITTGIWKGTAVGTSYGGTGLTTTATSGQLLIGNNNGYTLATLTAGTGIGITNTAGSITINVLGGTGAGTTYSANNGITKTASNFFQWGGQLSQLTTIDMNSNNIGFWNTGSFGIGTTSPGTGGKLHVASALTREGIPSSAVFSDTTDTTKGVFIGFNSTDDYGLIAASDDGAGWKNLSLNPIGGYIGIGTTNQGQLLTVGTQVGGYGGAGTANLMVNGANNTTFNGGIVRIFSTDTATTDFGGSLAFGGNYSGTANNIDFASVAGRKQIAMTSGGYLQFATREDTGNLTEKMRITSDGNVGIGTTSPGAPLDIRGNGTTSQNGLFVTTNSFTLLSSGTVLRIGHGATSGDTYSEIDSLTSGGTGIGNLVFNATGGNVGIGTSSPTQVLDVNGSVNVGGSLRTGTMLYVGTGVSVGTDVSINGGDLTSNQTTFRLLDNTVTTLYVGGAATSIELGAATGVLSINTGASVDGTLYTAANLRVGTSANITTNLNVGGTFRVNNSSFVLDNGGNITTGIWKGTAVGTSYGGTGLTTTATSGQLLIGNNNGYTLATITAGTGIGITNASGSITINALGSSGTGTTYSANNGITLTGSNFFQWGGQLSQLTTIDMNSNNIGFWGTGNVGIGYTNPAQKLDVNGGVNIGTSLTLGTMLYVGTGASVTGDVSVNGGDISSNQTTFRLLDNTVTTLNVGGAATVLELGAATGITSINNGASVDLSLSVNGGNITTNDASFNLLNGTATTINFGGAATLVELGAATGLVSINNGLSVDGNMYLVGALRVGSSVNIAGDLRIGTVGSGDLRLMNNQILNSVGNVMITFDGPGNLQTKFGAGNVGIGVGGGMSASGLFQVGIGGTPSFFIQNTGTDSGNVGVGTTTPVVDANPSRFFTVSGDTSKYGEISVGRIQALTNASVGGYNFFNSSITAAEKRIAAIWGNTDSNINSGALTFNTWDAGTVGERMRIAHDGNIGIGTTSPTGLLQIHSTGTSSNIRFTDAVTGVTVNDGIAFGYDNSYGGIIWNREDTNLVFATNNTEAVRIDNTGNVGIGTTSPGVKLTVARGGAVYNNSPTLGSGTIGVFSLLSGNGLFGLYSGISSIGDTWFQSQRNDANTAAYNILLNPGGGNVGIGLSSPNARLHVLSTGVGAAPSTSGSIDLTINSRICRGAVCVDTGMMNSGVGYIQNRDSDNYATNYGLALNPNGGNVGIGTTNPVAKLEVAGTTSTISNQMGDITMSPQSTNLNLNGNNITNIGNLYMTGIASTAPSATYYKLYINTANNKVYRTSTSGADMAEYYSQEGSLQKGEIVTISNVKDTVKATSSEYEQPIIGVVSTQPFEIMGTFKPGQIGIGLLGKLPVIVTTTNGNIQNGDPIASSVIPGVGMRATKAGAIVGKALESTDNWNSQTCSGVNSMSDISWPEDDGTNPNKPCFTLADGRIVGKIMVFANISWFDPKVEFSNSGDVVLNSPDNLYTGVISENALIAEGNSYSVSKANGEAINQVIGASDGIFAKIKSGLVNTQNLISQNLFARRINVQESVVSPLVEADRIKTDYLSPLASQNVTIDLTNSPFGKLIVKGDAEFTGNVGIGATLQAQDIVSENLTTKDATITGELVVESARIKKLRAESIVGLDAYFASMSAQNISTQNISGLEATPSADLSDLSILRELLASASAWPTVDPSNDVKIQTNVSILGVTTLAQTVVAGTLTQDGTLVFEDGNSINVIGGTLYLQDKATGGIDLLAGKVTIDQFGNAIFNGDLTVKGNLYAETIKATTKNITFDLSTPNSTESAFGKLIAMGADGKEAFSVDASGSATMAALQIQRPTETPAPNFDGTVSATSSAGVTEIASGTQEVTIKSPFISEKSLVYLTPIGSTQNQVLYIKSVNAEEKSFTIAVDQVATNSLKFNWWIIN